jgi:hypothetical protein
MSTILPVSPLTPHECSPLACLACRLKYGNHLSYLSDSSLQCEALTLSSVKTRIAFPPLFCTNVLGITSIASATALYGHPSTPTTVLAFACRPTLTAISVAPPPGASIGLKTTLRATDMASARLRSISFRMSLDGPRRRIVHAFGVSHSVRNVKYLLMEIIIVRIMRWCRAFPLTRPRSSRC